MPELRVPAADAPATEWHGRRLALTAWVLSVSDKFLPVAERTGEELEIPTFLRR